MRMGSEMAVTAAEIVNETAEGELANLLYRFGEVLREFAALPGRPVELSLCQDWTAELER